MAKYPLKIIPLGGMGEVGRNMMVYEYDNEILVVDTGLMFPDNDMLGVDYIIPDFQYLRERKALVKGIVVTHGHEDHTGAIHHVMEELDAPVYATPLTRGLLELKLARNKLADKVKLNTVHAGESTIIGPFKVEYFHVCHSVPDGVGLGITSPAGLVVHMTDFKFDHTPVDNWPTDYAKLAELSSRGVMALLADSTNAERSGWTPSERVIDAAFDNVFREAKGRILIASFASLVSRMQQVANAAQRYGRKMAFVGVSMVDNANMARELKYLDIPDDLLISVEEARHMKDHKVVIMCTGSQGEPLSIMGRLAAGTSRVLEIKDSDTVMLSSHPIPGNEEAVYKTINSLFERGANVIYEAIAPVHVSGHASQEELKLLMHLTRPKYFIPIHGEIRHLKQHARLAMEIGIPKENIEVIENGQTVLFLDGKMRLGNRINTSYIFVDGTGVGDVDPQVMHEREILAMEGVVIVNVQLNRANGRLQADPQVMTKGFMLTHDMKEMSRDLRGKIADAIRKPTEDPQKVIENTVKNYLYAETHRRPMVIVNVVKS